MTRRLALAWCWGSVCGLAVGWVYGSAVRDLAAFRALRGSARRSDGLPAAPRPDARPTTTAAQTGAQPLRWVDLFGIDPDYTDGLPTEEWLDRTRRGIPTQRDDEPCPQYSPGGGIPCSVTGAHTAHIFLGSCAPDAKDDADERIE